MAIPAILTGLAIGALMVGFRLVMQQRRGTLNARDEVPFILGMLGILALLVVAFASGPAVALIFPPLVILGGGAYLVSVPNQRFRSGLSTRLVGAIAIAAGLLGLIGGALRLSV